MASSKRERELARRRLERQMARRAAAEARRRQIRRNAIASVVGVVLLALLVVLVLPKLGGDGDKATTTASPAASGRCTYNDSPEPAAKKVNGKPPSTPPTSPATRTATLQTNRGTIELSLLASKAPCTVNSFAFLAGQQYFDGTGCHRLTTGSLAVLQCGDPSGTGSGGPGYQFAEENLNGATYPAGTVAMARTATPGSNGSQFFLVYKDSTLPPDYTPFGTITKGLDVLNTVAKGGSDPAGDGKPKLPVTLTKVTVS